MDEQATRSPRGAWIGVGSNLGDRRSRLEAAVSALGALSAGALSCSSVWASPSVGGPPGAPDFENLVVRIDSRLNAPQLVGKLQAIEARHGRRRSTPNAPRTLDLDLLWLDGERSSDARALVPHPRMWQRRFVLAPLAEISPDLRCGVTGRTVAEALSALPPRPPAWRVGTVALADPTSL